MGHQFSSPRAVANHVRKCAEGMDAGSGIYRDRSNGHRGRRHTQLDNAVVRLFFAPISICLSDKPKRCWPLRSCGLRVNNCTSPLERCLTISIIAGLQPVKLIPYNPRIWIAVRMYIQCYAPTIQARKHPQQCSNDVT
jgi:hypothetical protein